MRKITTPATLAIAAGLLTVGTLYAISESKNGDSSTAAGHFLTLMCQLAVSNSIATLVTTGATVTAATYTFIAKPLSWLYSKCCCVDTKKDESRYLLGNTSGPNPI